MAIIEFAINWRLHGVGEVIVSNAISCSGTQSNEKVKNDTM